MHLHNPADPGEGVVVSNERCMKGKSASYVRHLVVDISSTRLRGAFRAGQSFGVIPPGVDAKGRPHQVRLYSIAAPTEGEDGHGCHVSTTVKRTIDEHWETHKLFLGVASNFLCDLNPGDTIKVTGPSGKRFVLPVDAAAHDYVFFATGTGIAPFRGMLMDLFGRDGSRCPAGRAPRVVLVMGAPYDTDLIYDDWLRDLEQRQPTFRYLTALSRQPQQDTGRGLYVQDRLRTHGDLLTGILTSDRSLVYICGIAGMELGILQELSRVLTPDALEPFLTVDPEVRGQEGAWAKSMLHRQLKVSRRVFMEVYS